MTELNLEKMTTTEKLLVMETLWNDLCAHSQIESPSWHEEVLNKRHQLRQNGMQEPLDWNEAKKEIHKRIR